MGNQITLDEIMKLILSHFRKGPPNGWLLGWSESRHFNLVSDAAAPYATTNFTSFDYGFCNWFQVRIDGDTDYPYWTLTVKLSFVAPVYCVHWTWYETSTHGTVIPTAPIGYQIVEENVRIAVESVGFFEIPAEWYERNVKGVELELSGTEGVTVGKCLFSDYAE